jgi:hypothetical protein
MNMNAKMILDHSVNRAEWKAAHLTQREYGTSLRANPVPDTNVQ